MKLFKSKKLFMIVVFLGGLLMGALLFWAFSSILDDFSGKNASVNSDYVVVSDAEMIESITTSRSIAEALTCSTIAIVNLDDGAMQDEKQIYFAKELLSDLDDRFIYTGLEDAKTGMNNGIYAAYAQKDVQRGIFYKGNSNEDGREKEYESY